MSFDYVVHKPVKGGAEHEMTEHPYIQIGNVLIRDGQFWGASGVGIPMEDISDDIWACIATWSQAARDSVGIGTKAEMMSKPVIESRPPVGAKAPPPGKLKTRLPTPPVQVTRTDEPEKPEDDDDDDDS